VPAAFIVRASARENGMEFALQAATYFNLKILRWRKKLE
jgi:hypothetical protein